MMWGFYAAAMSGIIEAQSDLKAFEAADTPEKKDAFHRVRAERDRRRHELAVAQASAPVVNVTNKIYVW